MQTIGHISRFLLVSIIPQKLTDAEALLDLRELKSLVQTYGGEVVDLVVQRREIHDKGMYVGKGKMEEVELVVKEQSVDIVVMNAIIRPGQILIIQRQLEKINPQIKVWDRIDLILELFNIHAHTSEAKLQIELASMRHMGPRIYGMGMELSRQGGGIGTLGIGETNTELMQRHWKSQMKKAQDRLKKHTEERERQLERRSRSGLETVSIIGYTNAGKTSLFNLLTGKKNVVRNALFVTLDSSTGKIKLPKSKRDILLSDTIGFIRNLPASLIDAFKSTLMESIHAHVLLIVIDVTDENMTKKVRLVENVLGDLRINQKKRIYVFNKIDEAKTLDEEALRFEYQQYPVHFVSVKQKKGIEELVKTIEEELETITDEPIIAPKYTRKQPHI